MKRRNFLAAIVAAATPIPRRAIRLKPRSKGASTLAAEGIFPQSIAFADFLSGPYYFIAIDPSTGKSSMVEYHRDEKGSVKMASAG